MLYIRYLGRLCRVSGAAWCRTMLLGAVLASWVGLAAHGQDETAPQRSAGSIETAQAALLGLEEIPAVPAPATQPVHRLDEQPEVQELYQAALELYDEELFEGVVDRLDRALDLAADDYYQLHYLMGLAKYRLGDYGEARAFAELAASLHHGDVDTHYLLGKLYRKQGQLERATAQFRTVTLAAEREADNPRVTTAWLELGECLAEGGYLTAACESFARFDEAIWSTHPEHRHEEVVAELLEGRPHGVIDARLDLLRELGRADDAVDAAAEALERRPDDPHLARAYVRALLEAGRADEALAYCQERLAALPADARREYTGAPSPSVASSPFVSLAVAAAQTAGCLDEWLAELIRDVGDGHRVELARAVAGRLSAAGRDSTAMQVWRAIVAQQPDDIDSAWGLASAVLAAGELEPAVTTLTEFVRRHPDAAEVPSVRFEAWVRGWRAADEPPGLVARLTARPDRDFAYKVVLATVAGAAGEDELAAKLFNAALEDRPGFALAHVAWGRLLLAEYRWADAKTQARAALEVAPDLAAAHFIMAAAHDGLDENEEAADAFQAALEYGPDDAGYALAAARHYRRVNNLPAAQRYFQQAFAADPVNGEALESLIESYLGGGKLGVARAQLAKAEASDLPADALRRIRTMLDFAEQPLSAEHLAELSRQFDEFPQDLETGLRLAAGLYVRGRWEQAFSVAQRVSALDPDDDRILVLMARLHGRRLEFDRATKQLEELARRYPNRTDMNVLLAENYLADFHPAEARRILRHLIALESDEPARQSYRWRLALSYIEFREYDEALALLDEWIAEDPERDYWTGQKVRVLLLAGQDQAAVDLAAEGLAPVIEKFRQFYEEFQATVERLKAAPDDPAIGADAKRLQTETERAHDRSLQRCAAFVQVCIEAHRPDAALEGLNEFQPATPHAQALLHRWRAQAEAAAGRVDRAIAELESLLAEGPSGLSQDDRADTLWQFIRILKDAGRTEAVATWADRAIAELDSVLAEGQTALDRGERANVWEPLIGILEETGRYDDALKRCDEWFQTDFDTSDDGIRALLLSRKCTTLMLAGRVAEYQELAEQWLELEPDNIGLNNDLGYTWVDSGRNLEQATRMIRRAVAADPLRAAYLDSLGWAYYKAGDFSAAREYLGRAVRLREGQDPVLYDHLADAEWRLGNKDVARRHWQKSLELIEEQQLQGGGAERAELLPNVRAKVRAAERSEPARVAPTAAEQDRE